VCLGNILINPSSPNPQPATCNPFKLVIFQDLTPSRQGLGILKNIRLLFSPGYIQARLSVELHLVSVAWQQFYTVLVLSGGSEGPIPSVRSKVKDKDLTPHDLTTYEPY